MSDELLADTSAPEQVATAAPETEVSTPEAEAPKTFTQEELDAIVSKRLAREQRKWERQQQQPVKAPVELPPADQFESVEAYADALAARKAEELIRTREASARQAEMLDAYHDREEEARSKYDDFEQVAYNPNLPFLQAKEIGRLEAKLVTEPMTKQVSKAPEPISPVKPRGATTPVIDTTDPRSIKSMSVSEWIEADRQRQMKKAEARNR